MQHQIKEKDCACFLVQVVSTKSKNRKWVKTIKKQKIQDERIRLVSIDEFYKIVTGDEQAFYKLCMALPELIAGTVAKGKAETPNDTVLQELKALAKNQGITNNKDFALLMAIYMLGFGSYMGFSGAISD
jgi:Uma2 family endonuclease